MWDITQIHGLNPHLRDHGGESTVDAGATGGSAGKARRRDERRDKPCRGASTCRHHKRRVRKLYYDQKFDPVTEFTRKLIKQNFTRKDTQTRSSQTHSKIRSHTTTTTLPRQGKWKPTQATIACRRTARGLVRRAQPSAAPETRTAQPKNPHH